MTSKTNEKDLSFQRTAMREARGYFLGIIDILTEYNTKKKLKFMEISEKFSNQTNYKIEQ